MKFMIRREINSESMSEGQIEREFNFLGHIYSPAIFIAEDRPKSLNIWLLRDKSGISYERK